MVEQFLGERIGGASGTSRGCPSRCVRWACRTTTPPRTCSASSARATRSCITSTTSSTPSSRRARPSTATRSGRRSSGSCCCGRSTACGSSTYRARRHAPRHRPPRLRPAGPAQRVPQGGVPPLRGALGPHPAPGRHDDLPGDREARAGDGAAPRPRPARPRRSGAHPRGRVRAPGSGPRRGAGRWHVLDQDRLGRWGGRHRRRVADGRGGVRCGRLPRPPRVARHRSVASPRIP